MSFFKTLKGYIILARLHSAVLTGLTPLFGALAMDPNLDFFLIFQIFFIGIFVHIYGFVLNEFFDVEVDKRSKDLSDKPLVSGRIKPVSALVVCSGSAFLSYILLILSLNIDNFWWPQLFLILTLLTFFAYDKWGKKLIIADVLLAAFVGFLCLMGASLIDWPVSGFASVIAALAFLQLFLQNALADLKDVAHDKKAGAKTTAIRFGAEVNLKSNTIKIPRLFSGYIGIVKIIHIALILGYLYYFAELDTFQLSAIIIVIVIMLSILQKILIMRRFEREKLIRLIGGHEIVTYILIPLLFINILSLLTIVLLIVFPIIWLACFMMFMYGRMLPRI